MEGYKAWAQLTDIGNSKAIVPIGVMFSLSLIFGNFAYLYLSVSFIQMLKVSSLRVCLLMSSTGRANRIMLGYKCCRHSPCYLGFRHGCPELKQIG